MYRSSLVAIVFASLLHAGCTGVAAQKAAGGPAASRPEAAEASAPAAGVPAPRAALGTCRVVGADRAVLLSALGEGETNATYGGLVGDEIGEAHGLGGLGLKGTGPGGGGTGWGTIGTGTKGTPGAPSGYGSGSGYGRGRTAGKKQPPKVVPGRVVPSGNLDKNIIRRVIRRHLRKIRYCYEKQLLVNPNLAGTVRVDFVIDRKGNVATARASGMHNTVAQCVARAVRAMQFPAPKGGGVVKVSYPFKFQSSSGGGTAAATQPLAPPPPPPRPPPPSGYVVKTGKTPSLEPGVVGGILTRPAFGRGCLDVEPGESVIAAMPAVEACYRQELGSAPTMGGRLFLSLTADQTGKLTERTATGVGSDAFRACVADAFASATLPVREAKREETETVVCSIGLHNARRVYGPKEADLVTVEPAKLLYGDAVLGNQIQWSTDPEGNAWRALNLLLQALPKDSKDRTMVMAAQPDVDAAAYITNVNFVAVEAARHHFVFARTDTDAGRAYLNPLGSPAWSRHCGDVPSSEPLLALLTSEGIIFGTASGRFTVAPSEGAQDLIGYARVLRKLKRSDYRHRSDLKIAATPGVPFRVLAKMIEIAADTGFFDVHLFEVSQYSDRDPRKLAPATGF